MEVNEYCEIFENAMAKVKDKEVAIAIMQEVGKDSRTPHFKDKSNSNYEITYEHVVDPREGKRPLEGPATDKQKALLTKWGITFPEDLSKLEADHLIKDNKEKHWKSK